MKKSRPSHVQSRLCYGTSSSSRTNDEAFHFVFFYHVHSKDLPHLIIKFVSPSAGGHNAKVCRSRAVEFQLLATELFDEVDAQIDAVGLEVEEVQSPTSICRSRLSGEVNELRQGSSDLRRSLC